jgi:hypothetical protein
MKRDTQLPIAALLLAAPMSAFADGIPHVPTALAAFAGGFFGGLVGAGVVCWICHRRRRNGDEPKKY